MRVALFTCLFVVCFGNKAHQCGDKLGSCGAPQASLMQVGSSNKRRMSLVSQSASRSGSRVSRALAGFEKYTNNLVSKYGTDRKTIPLSSDVIAAIDTVRNYINGLFFSLNESHYHDIDRIHTTCGPDAELGCRNLYFNSITQADLQTKKGDTELKRVAHVQCRVDERNETCQRDVNCEAYDTFRLESDYALPEDNVECAFPDQGGLGKLANGFINVIDESPDGKRSQMETCLKKFRVWFTRLYDLYLGCDRGDTVAREDCTDKQASFEEKHCEYNVALNSTCHNYDVCIDEAQDDCNGTTGLCNEVDILVSARKAENETGERILCLLTVLVDTSDEDKKKELDICTNKTYDTSYFDLDCPGDDAYPKPNPPIPCSIEPVPCEQKFLEKYYASSENNPDTGAHLIPYEAVCDCSYKCAALVGDAADKVVHWGDPVDGISKCGLFPDCKVEEDPRAWCDPNMAPPECPA